ncbi:MAG TPA: glycosyltransferase family 9 protein [Candidatus Binataceae bacterium]|nr:glycosyltransferase family 9 protein [Candidatus Binataceae bacterium]
MIEPAPVASHDPPRRVLIILMGAIGDVVRALPLLGRVRRTYPQAHIAWAVEPKSAPILRNHRWLDDLIIYDRAHAPWSFLPFLYRIGRDHFDLVIDLQRHFKSGLAGWVSRAPRRLGFAPTNTKEVNHWFTTEWIPPQPNLSLKLVQYQAFADTLGLDPAPIEFGLRASVEERARIDQLLAGAPRPLLGLILGSSWPSRLYFPDSIAQVARLMHKRHALTPVLIGTGAEQALAQAVEAELGELPRVSLVGRTGLHELVAVFEACAAAFGPDCGPMHIAAAVKCPVVSLWGSTSPLRSAPWGCAELAISAPIPCHPCYLRRCPIDRECMRRISPRQVAAKLERSLAPAAIPAR